MLFVSMVLTVFCRMMSARQKGSSASGKRDPGCARGTNNLKLSLPAFPALHPQINWDRISTHIYSLNLARKYRYL